VSTPPTRAKTRSRRAQRWRQLEQNRKTERRQTRLVALDRACALLWTQQPPFAADANLEERDAAASLSFAADDRRRAAQAYLRGFCELATTSAKTPAAFVSLGGRDRREWLADPELSGRIEIPCEKLRDAVGRTR